MPYPTHVQNRQDQWTEQDSAHIPGDADQQEFDQIRNDRMISNWLGRWEQFKNFIPVTKKGKSYFMRRQVYSERDSEMALFHFHHVLESNNDVLQSTKNGALNVKYQIIEIIQLLKEE